MRSQFITTLNCRLSDDESYWILNAPLFYESEHLGCMICVPTGFKTDFASVPRIPFVYACWGNRAHHEAVVHDAMYRIDFTPKVSFNDANKVFLEVMKVRNKPLRIRLPMYCAVCLFGKSSYHKKKMFDKL